MSNGREGDVFRVLLVCTSNVCRSPGAAAALSSRWAEAISTGAVQVNSAGTRAREGVSACRMMSHLYDGHRSSRDVLEAHRSVRLTIDHLNWADLVLTAERTQRAEIITMEPALRGHTFTMNEVARLYNQGQKSVGSLAPSGWDSPWELIGRLNDIRGETTVSSDRPSVRWPRWHRHPAHPDDIIDAHLRGNARHRLAAKAIADAVNLLTQPVSGRTSVN